jgi:hypothetical protein
MQGRITILQQSPFARAMWRKRIAMLAGRHQLSAPEGRICRRGLIEPK